AQKRRYLTLLELHAKNTGADTPVVIVNAPGRTELAGNHTDHNNGCVLAASVDLDCVVVASPVEENKILLDSDQNEPIVIGLENLAPRLEEQGTAQALVRGVAAVFFRLTGVNKGFCAQLDATCPPGKGLSSSAAFSVLIGHTLNVLFNDGQLSVETLAQIAKEAENDYFGKPCGLMDQLASAVGQTVFIDFYDQNVPVVEAIKFGLSGTGYKLAVIDTGGSHVELTPEYAAIPEEMFAAAGVLGAVSGRMVKLEAVFKNIGKIRKVVGDRAFLRLLHFVEESERVERMAGCLKKNDFSGYLFLVKQSGLSSQQLLQNCSSSINSREQGILVGLAMSQRICSEVVCRVHGGGFAGTVQSYIPDDMFIEYTEKMEDIFGENSVFELEIGRPGVCCLTENGLTF
ncbi:MAG: galactokinase, partial [Desulfobulbaceae bacterium]|nr:galactokinase [Desulfobulbaceae bacterium]